MRREPAVVAIVVQIAGVVQRDRFEEDAHRPGCLRRGDAGMKHRRGIVGAGRGRDHYSWNVADRGNGVVVVEVPAEPLLVSVAGHANHHRIAVLPVGKELQRRTLAANLVRRVVKVGQVLDLRDRQQPRHSGAEREAEDRLLVEQRVEHPRGTGLAEKATGDAVHATLAGDVLAEDHRLRVAIQDVVQRTVDRERKRQRRVRVAGPHRRDKGRRVGVDGFLKAVPQRLHHRSRAVELRQLPELTGELDNVGTLGLVTFEDLRGSQCTGIDQRLRRAQRRVPLEIGGDLVGTAIRRLVVRTGMPHQPDHPQMQERRSTVCTHPGGCRGRSVERRRHIAPVGLEIPQSVAVSVSVLDPATRCLDADADPVVLADEQQRHRHTLIRGVQGGVDGADRGGVVHRCVTEAAHRYGIVGPRARDAQFSCARDGERDPDGPRKVRCDGRGLRNDVQVVAAEHLVSPACDRLIGGCHQPEYNVAQRVSAFGLSGAGQKETARTIVQQGGIGHTKRRRHRGVAFMS